MYIKKYRPHKLSERVKAANTHEICATEEKTMIFRSEGCVRPPTHPTSALVTINKSMTESFKVAESKKRGKIF